MSDANPYQSSDPGPIQPGEHAPMSASGPLIARRVRVSSFELMRRGHALMGEQYMLMVGVCLVAILVGSLVPLGLIMGAMFVGMYLCLMQREQLGRTEFGTVFKGFDFFVDSMVVVLITAAVSLLVLIPCYIIGFIGMIAVMAAGQGSPEVAGVLAIVGFFGFFVFVLLASMLIYLPFVFSFQLIADRHLKAGDAIKASWQGVRVNLFGVFKHLTFLFASSMLASLMCYIPAFFLLPISVASLFVLYRDIFGPGTYGPPPLTLPTQPGYVGPPVTPTPGG